MNVTIRSIGCTLLIQCIAVEILSIAMFSQTPAGVVGGFVAPWVGFIGAAFLLYRGSPADFLVTSWVALLLFAASLLLWFRWRKRFAAHVALALFSLLSMALVLGAM